MIKNKLRHYVPISAPSTRELLHGDERDFRVSLGFTPGWFHKRLGIDFSETWHTDPKYRYSSLLKCKLYLHHMFPCLEAFRPVYNTRGIETSCATISGVYGACPVGAVYGLPVRFGPADWPDTYGYMTKAELIKLRPIRLKENVFVQELMRQMDRIEELYGKIDGYLAFQGILNNAFRLMGQNIFTEMCLDAGFVEFLFAHIYETMVGFAKLVQARQRKSGFDVNLLSVSNCVINMISQEMYERYLLPYDKKIAEEFPAFGIHTCNWDVTRYMDSFGKIPNISYMDMGMMSDMPKLRAAFPDVRFAVLYHPNDIEKKPLNLVREDFEKIRREAAPCDLALVDISAQADDDRIRKVVELAYKIEIEGT